MQSTSASGTPFTRNRWSVRAVIVDDDAPIRELLCGYLARFNIEAIGMDDGQGMRQALAEERFDVDLMQPGEDGLSFCRWLWAESDISILMLTARCEPADRIIGLEMGAADYMAKPFEPRELVARIQTILRRVRDDRDAPRTESRNSIRFDAWRLDNALRFAGHAHLRLEDGQKQVRIDVCDHGPGIPAELREAVFESFYRVEGSRNRNSGGIGLGLTIARDAARRQGGDLELLAPEAGGLLARLTLPLR